MLMLASGGRPRSGTASKRQAASHRRRVRDRARVAQGRGRRWRLQGIIPWLSDARVAEGHNEVEEGLPDQRPRPTLDVAEFIRRFLLHVLPAASTASDITACSPAPFGR